MSAVAEVPVNTPVLAPAGLLQRVTALDRSARLRLGAALALVLVAVVAALFYARQPDYRVLFSGLGDKDAGAIVAQLTQMNVPYKYSDGGGAIMVPGNRVHDARLRLATQGLPKGTVAGFELMENSKFGITQFQERLNFQRGLEGELTRSIQALASVQSARVHLALPNQNGFFREQVKPSASVLVSLYPGRFLDRAQLAGIVHLVSSSVPDMAPTAVSVLDDTGKLLSQSPDGASGNNVDAQQLAYVQQIEQQYTRRILDMLEPVVGKSNVKAQVTAEVDFSRTDSTVEQHRPNLSPDSSAVRSQQILENAAGPDGAKLPATGVPGAISNQPPQSANAPINGANPPPSAGGAGAGAGAGADGAGVAKRELVTNYEVDKTTQVTRGSAGAIKRVNAAVVVNYQMVAPEPGKPAEPKALSAEQIEQMTALVRESVGYNKERGDSVNLMNAPFMSDEPTQVDLPLWRQPEVLELAKSAGWPVGISLGVALLLLLLLRPLVKGRKELAVASATAAGAGASAQIDAIAGDQLERPALPPPTKPEDLAPTAEQLRLEDARKLARENPLAVANILKNWVNGE